MRVYGAIGGGVLGATSVVGVGVGVSLASSLAAANAASSSAFGGVVGLSCRPGAARAGSFSSNSFLFAGSLT